jgi:Flp pilus assembly pilin Flp
MSFLDQLWQTKKAGASWKYAVMLVLILIMVMGSVRLIGAHSKTVFSNVASSMHGGDRGELDAASSFSLRCRSKLPSSLRRTYAPCANAPALSSRLPICASCTALVANRLDSR